MSKMGNIHFQAQEDAIDGTMDKKSFLDEYGADALDIWEECLVRIMMTGPPSIPTFGRPGQDGAKFGVFCSGTRPV